MAGIIEQKYFAGEPMVEHIHLKIGQDLFVMQFGFHPYYSLAHYAFYQTGMLEK